MTRSTRTLLAAWLLPVGLAACAAPSPGPHVPAATRLSTENQLMPSGAPYDGPRGPVSSAPPLDNGGSRLRCHPEGIGERCDRGNADGS